MENTPENKEIFITQYWRQRILRNPYDTQIYYINEKNIDWFKEERIEIWIELIPLTLISDEDVRYLLGNRILKNSTIYKIERQGIWTIVKTKWKYNGKTKRREHQIHATDLNNYQYLQSKGYALPWMGLSVDKLIEYGWIKLKN